MERLTALDASFLEYEDTDPHVSLAVGGVSVLAGPALPFEDLLSAFADRVQVVPRCTQVVRTHPLDLGAPEWVADDNFDITHHVHRAALPAPGGDKELFEMIASVMERRLERERPLWECVIIEGLADGRWAMLMKLHHCIADGIAMPQMLAKLGDEPGGGDFAKDFLTARKSGPVPLRLPELSLNPITMAGNLMRAAVAAAAMAQRAAVGAAELTAGLASAASGSSLTGPVGTMRRYSAASVALADMNKISKKFDVTLNDVALAAITDSYRAVLLARGEEPRADSLRTLVPVSNRSVGDLAKTDNQVTIMLPLLPVDEADPVKRLHLVHSRLTRTKGSGQREGGGAFSSIANMVPFALSAWTTRLLIRIPQRAIVTLATNVPGPRTQQQLMGREVLEILPVPPIFLSLRTGVAMVSYADRFTFGITADYDSAPDIDELATGIEHAVARLLDASRPARRRQRA